MLSLFRRFQTDFRRNFQSSPIIVTDRDDDREMELCIAIDADKGCKRGDVCAPSLNKCMPRVAPRLSPLHVLRSETSRKRFATVDCGFNGGIS